MTYNIYYLKKTMMRVVNFSNEVGLAGIGPVLMLVVIKIFLLLNST